jgi:hypothetical protein
LDCDRLMDSTNYDAQQKKFDEMLKTAHFLSHLLKQTRLENAMLRAELEKHKNLEGNH